MNRMGKEFLDNESGAVAMICAALLVVFCGFAALAIDYGQIVYVRRELTKAAEAGALSGARALWPVDLSTATGRVPNWSNADDKARTTATNNLPTPTTDVVTVEVGRWDYINTFTVDHVNPNGVRVTIRRNNVPTTFAKILTPTPINVERTATAVMDCATAVGKGSLPIAVNLDKAKKPGDVITIFWNPAPGENGGWFSVPPASASGATFKDYIDNGSCPVLQIGDTIALNNGEVTAALQALEAERIRQLAAHPDGWEVIVPVVVTSLFTGSDQIVSFVTLNITEPVITTGNPKYLTATILNLGETQSGQPGPGGNKTGALAPPKLVL